MPEANSLVHLFTDLAHEKYDPLSKEEELQFARHIRASGSMAPIPDIVIFSRNRLIETNLRFAISVAKNVHKNSSLPLDEAISLGYSGLIYAIDKFDPDRNCKVFSFAVYWIRETISDYLRKDSKYKKFLSNSVNECWELECEDNVHDLIYNDQDFFSEIIDNDYILQMINKMPYILSIEEILILSLYYKINSPFKENLNINQIAALLNQKPSKVNSIRIIALSKLKNESKKADF